MTNIRFRRPIVRCAVAVLGLVAAARPAAAAQWSMTVEPGVGLADGQTVTVRWDGSTAEHNLTVRPCVVGLSGVRCSDDVATWTVAPASSSGAVRLTVASTVRIAGSPVPCGPQRCVLSLGEDVVAPAGGAGTQIGGAEILATLSFGEDGYTTPSQAARNVTVQGGSNGRTVSDAAAAAAAAADGRAAISPAVAPSGAQQPDALAQTGANPWPRATLAGALIAAGAALCTVDRRSARRRPTTGL